MQLVIHQTHSVFVISYTLGKSEALRIAMGQLLFHQGELVQFEIPLKYLILKAKYIKK